jgi:hypothetical protein
MFVTGIEDIKKLNTGIEDIFYLQIFNIISPIISGAFVKLFCDELKIYMRDNIIRDNIIRDNIIRDIINKLCTNSILTDVVLDQVNKVNYFRPPYKEYDEILAVAIGSNQEVINAKNKINDIFINKKNISMESMYLIHEIKLIHD